MRATMQRSRTGYVVWALLGFGFINATSSDARAQRLAPEFALARGAIDPLSMAAARGEGAAQHEGRERLREVEREASGGARRVLTAARTMFERAVSHRGTCATWLNTVYQRAGGRFSTVFSSGRGGRYADESQLRPGDWVRFVNHSFHGVGHSAIFIGWANPQHTVALTLSHPGQYRRSHGRFHAYDFRNVYQIDRMAD